MKNPVFTGAGVAIITPMYEDSCVEHIGTLSSFSRPGPNASQRPYI